MRSVIWRLGEQIGGHDQRVLAVVGVVARAHADRPEAEAPVELPRRLMFVSRTSSVMTRALRSSETSHQARASAAPPMPAPAPLGQHREGGDVRLVDHQPQAAVGDGLVCRHGRPGSAPGGWSGAPGGRRSRPRHGEAGTLDVVDGGHVVERIGSMRTLSGGRATMSSPPPLRRCRAAGQRRLAQASAGSSDSPSRQGARARAAPAPRPGR